MSDPNPPGHPESAAEPLRHSMERLRTSLTPGDLDHTLAQIVRAAVAALPQVDRASITVRHDDGRLETAQPSVCAEVHQRLSISSTLSQGRLS